MNMVHQIYLIILKKIILDEEKHNYNSSYILTLLNKNINKEKDKLITQLKPLRKKI